MLGRKIWREAKKTASSSPQVLTQVCDRRLRKATKEQSHFSSPWDPLLLTQWDKVWRRIARRRALKFFSHHLRNTTQAAGRASKECPKTVSGMISGLFICFNIRTNCVPPASPPPFGHGWPANVLILLEVIASSWVGLRFLWFLSLFWSVWLMKNH